MSARRWFEDGALHFGLGVEDTFVPQSGPGERAIDEYALTDHYAKYASDLQLAVDAGATFLRWGCPGTGSAPPRGSGTGRGWTGWWTGSASWACAR